MVINTGQVLLGAQKSSLLTFDKLMAEFSSLLVQIRLILSQSPKQKDNLEVCKELCTYLKASNSANIPLFSQENISKINNCSDFRQLFEIMGQYFSWEEPSILNEIIIQCRSDEAEEEFQKYKRKMELWILLAALKVIHHLILKNFVS